MEKKLQSSIEEPTADAVFQLTEKLQTLINRLKQPLDDESRSRVDELIKKLESSIPELESKLSEMNGDALLERLLAQRRVPVEKQSETDNEGDSDTDEDAGDTSSSKKKRGLKQNSEVTRILEELNKDGNTSASRSPQNQTAVRQFMHDSN